MNGDRTPVIVGVGLSDYPRAPHLTATQHHALAMQRAIADCGIEKSEIDGYVTASESRHPMDDAVSMAEYLGIDHRYLENTMVGGSSFELHVQHLAAAIREGLCEVGLVTYGSDRLSRMGRSLGTGGHQGAGDQRVVGPAQYETPYGNTLVGSYAMHAMRHMSEYGTTSEQLAEIAVGVREYASMNPNAMYRDPITVDDVLNSRMVADPLHKLDCCVVSDGGGAFIMTTAERARDLSKPPVYVLGSGAAQSHWNITQQRDFSTSAGVPAGAVAFERAGVKPDDIDMVMIYDSFTITVLILLESLGFVGRGEGGPFVSEGHLKRGGTLPMNTDGGGLSSCHPGMRGLFLIAEAVRQLRGEAGPVQVPDCSLALCAGSGGWLSVIGVNILGTEHP